MHASLVIGIMKKVRVNQDRDGTGRADGPTELAGDHRVVNAAREYSPRGLHLEEQGVAGLLSRNTTSDGRATGLMKGGVG
ncbi:hypothetical protein EVAR_391_1 [Eumeta japonica]|uniref:Uncharacterized protein n=1 Tax=Eumeta variegata TaxID=151549 RepID=A0A4C1SA74_EUMVA|nr:hypothetical protein EVAR_391_1 [Eumeta japonica]